MAGNNMACRMAALLGLVLIPHIVSLSALASTISTYVPRPSLADHGRLSKADSIGCCSTIRLVSLLSVSFAAI